MKKAMTYFFSDDIHVEEYREADSKGIHHNIRTTKGHVAAALLIAHDEGHEEAVLEIGDLVRTYPNDSELGEMIRSRY